MLCFLLLTPALTFTFWWLWSVSVLTGSTWNTQPQAEPAEHRRGPCTNQTTGARHWIFHPDSSGYAALFFLLFPVPGTRAMERWSPAAASPRSAGGAGGTRMTSTLSSLSPKPVPPTRGPTATNSWMEIVPEISPTEGTSLMWNLVCLFLFVKGRALYKASSLTCTVTIQPFAFNQAFCFSMRDANTITVVSNVRSILLVSHELHVLFPRLLNL